MWNKYKIIIVKIIGKIKECFWYIFFFYKKKKHRKKSFINQYFARDFHSECFIHRKKTKKKKKITDKSLLPEQLIDLLSIYRRIKIGHVSNECIVHFYKNIIKYIFFIFIKFPCIFEFYLKIIIKMYRTLNNMSIL